jgi:hypothetical protein
LNSNQINTYLNQNKFKSKPTSLKPLTNKFKPLKSNSTEKKPLNTHETILKPFNYLIETKRFSFLLLETSTAGGGTDQQTSLQ